MKRLLFSQSIIFVFLISSFTNYSFKNEQKKYQRVLEAYNQKEKYIDGLLELKHITKKELEIYLRVFKNEKELELWGKNKSSKSFIKLKTYKICSASGQLGPKRKQGDGQVPEGFYRIDRFNPQSNFYLSLGLNYPNKSDRILGKNNLGGDIFIHGDCVSIGCMAMTDDKIMEIYILCVEAKANGQNSIPVTIFPARLTNANYSYLTDKYSSDKDKINLWTDLKSGYDYFETDHKLPSIEFLENGRYKLK